MTGCAKNREIMRINDAAFGRHLRNRLKMMSLDTTHRNLTPEMRFGIKTTAFTCETSDFFDEECAPASTLPRTMSFEDTGFVLFVLIYASFHILGGDLIIKSKNSFGRPEHPLHIRSYGILLP